MIRATGTMKGRNFVLLGMDRENIIRLTAGKPIIVKMESVGIERDVILCFGETLQALTDELIAAGFIIPREGTEQ